MPNPLDSFAGRRGSIDIKVPKMPLFSEHFIQSGLKGGIASWDAAMEKWRQELQRVLPDSATITEQVTTIINNVIQAGTTPPVVTPPGGPPSPPFDPSALLAMIAQLQTDLSAHILQNIVHGTSSPVVGETDEQALERKTIGFFFPRNAKFQHVIQINEIISGEGFTVPTGFNMIVAGPFEIAPTGDLIVEVGANFAVVGEDQQIPGNVSTDDDELVEDELVVGAGGKKIKTKLSPGDPFQFLNGGSSPPQFTRVEDKHILFSDVTTNDADTTRHGFSPKLPGDASKFYRGDGTFATIPVAAVSDADILFSDIITNNASTIKHGFLRKLSGNAGEYMDGTGNWSTPAGGISQLTGDVTAGPGTGSQAATIANDAVTYAKMQDISAASKLLGRGSAAGSGNPEEITLGTGLAMSATTLNVTVAGNVTTSVTLTDHAVVLGNGTSDVTVVTALGDVGQVLTSNGSGADPSWQTPAVDFFDAFFYSVMVPEGTSAFEWNMNISQATNVAPTWTGPSTAQPPSVTLTTSSVSGNVASWASGTGDFDWIPYNRDVSFDSYMRQNDTTDVRHAAGMCAAALTNTNTPVTNCALLMNSTTAVAGVTTGNWYAFINNGSTTEAIDTGVASQSTTAVRLSIRWDGATNSKIRFYINGTLVATSTIDLDATQTLGVVTACTTLAASAKSFRISGIKARVKYGTFS